MKIVRKSTAKKDIAATYNAYKEFEGHLVVKKAAASKKKGAVEEEALMEPLPQTG